MIVEIYKYEAFKESPFLVIILYKKLKVRSEEWSKNRVMRRFQKKCSSSFSFAVRSFKRIIKFYTEAFGMIIMRQRDIPKKYSNAFIGFGIEEINFIVELTYNYGVDKYDIGTGFGHFAIETAYVCVTFLCY